MGRRSSLTLAVVSLSLLGQAATAVEFVLLYPSLRVPSHWFLEFAILLGLSFSLSVALPFAAKDYLRIILIYGRLLVVLVASIPEGKLVGIEMTLSAGLILESTTYLAPPRNILIVASIVALAGSSQISLPVWDTMTEVPTAEQILAYGAFLVTLSIVGLCLRRLSDALAAERRRNDALNESILQLTNANVGFQHYATTVSERSTEDERRRISREIHDTIGYTLTNIKMMIEASLDSLAQGRLDRLKRLLETMKEQALSGLAEARRSLRTLRAVLETRAGGDVVRRDRRGERPERRRIQGRREDRLRLRADREDLVLGMALVVGPRHRERLEAEGGRLQVHHLGDEQGVHQPDRAEVARRCPRNLPAGRDASPRPRSSSAISTT